jgi:hypothetical protein
VQQRDGRRAIRAVAAPGPDDLLHPALLADWVQRAARLSVAEGDFFGTGRLPPSSHGGLLIPHTWSVRD